MYNAAKSPPMPSSTRYELRLGRQRAVARHLRLNLPLLRCLNAVSCMPFLRYRRDTYLGSLILNQTLTFDEHVLGDNYSAVDLQMSAESPRCRGRKLD